MTGHQNKNFKGYGNQKKIYRRIENHSDAPPVTDLNTGGPWDTDFDSATALDPYAIVDED